VRLTRQLLRRHVRRRRYDGTPGILCIGEARGDPEVGQVAVPLLVEKHVRRFDVAVHDALAMRVGERAPDLGEQAGGRLEVPRTALERPLQRAPA
jgi:hypothetical protein